WRSPHHATRSSSACPVSFPSECSPPPPVPQPAAAAGLVSRPLLSLLVALHAGDCCPDPGVRVIDERDVPALGLLPWMASRCIAVGPVVAALIPRLGCCLGEEAVVGERLNNLGHSPSIPPARSAVRHRV